MADNSAGLGLRVRFVFGLYLTLFITVIYAAARCLFYALVGKWRVPCEQCGHHRLRELFNGILYVNVCAYVNAFERSALAYDDVTLRQVQEVSAAVRAELHKPHRIDKRSDQ